MNERLTKSEAARFDDLAADIRDALPDDRRADLERRMRAYSTLLWSKALRSIDRALDREKRRRASETAAAEVH